MWPARTRAVAHAGRVEYGRAVRCLVLVCLLAACSNGPTKREDASMPPSPRATPPAATAPKVVIETPAGEVTVGIEVVDTPPKIMRGLMFREHLPPDDGMLFLLGHDEDHAFYMRNTLIPLDMMFIRADKTIAGIVENAEPRTETLRRVGLPSRYVLEVNGGFSAAHGIKAGARVRFVNVRE